MVPPNINMSPTDKLKAVKGEQNQGNYLIEAKERHSDVKQKRGLAFVRQSTKRIPKQAM
jgi:hypothetical protein